MELSERQAAFVDAVTTRIWSGLPLNEHDFAAICLVASILELGPRPGFTTENR